MSFLSKYSKTKTITISELQFEILERSLKNRLNTIKEQKIDNFESIENEYSIKSLITLLEDTPWNK